jgi:hypothetical protein
LAGKTEKEKNPAIAALLGIFFGGFGLMYVSIGQGLFALAILFIVWLATGGVLPVLIWLSCGAWGYYAAIYFNEFQRKIAQEDAAIAAYQASVQPKSADPVRSGEASTLSTPNACAACGSAVRTGSKFCGTCGQAIC